MSEIQKGAEIKHRYASPGEKKSRTVPVSKAVLFLTLCISFQVLFEKAAPVCPEEGLMLMGKWWMFECRVLHTSHCHMSLFNPINPVLCDPDVEQPAPALLPCPLRPVSGFICASQVTKRPSQWINIKILFRGIRLGNILPSNAALARAKARQGINY